MRISLIIITLAALVSCGKKENNLGSSVSIEAFEQKNFLTIPHDEKNSLIRSKLLNSIVEQSFPALVNNSENLVKKNDELNKFEMSERDLKNYQEKEKAFSKVIVSYSNREEIYFVPAKIPVANLVKELELSVETDRVLKLMPVDNVKTYSGGTIYIVSANHADLMKNDQLFYQTKSEAMNNFTNQSLLIDSYKSVVLSVDYDFYLQKLSTQAFTGNTVRCTPEAREEGSCGAQCTYKRNMPSAEFEKVNEKSLEKLGFSVRLADKMISVNDLVVMNQKDGHFEVKIGLQEIVGDNFTLGIVQMPSVNYQRSAPGFDYTEICRGSYRSVNGNVTIQSKVNFSVTVNVFGRGAELKKIKL